MENKPIKLYIHASIVYKKQGSAVLITIRCEKTTILDKIPWDSNAKLVIVEEVNTSSKRIAIF